MKRILVTFMLLISGFLNAQTELLDAKKVNVKDSLRLNSKWIKSIATDTSLTNVTDRDIPSAKAIKEWFLNRYGNGTVLWNNVLNKPNNFPTTYALGADIQDSIIKRARVNFNLSDLTDFAAARSNLSVYSISNVDALLSAKLSATITSPATGNLIRYNGSMWVNWAPNFLTSYTETDPIWSGVSSSYWLGARVSDSLTAVQARIQTKQPFLVSGTNIRTVNGNSLLGSTDLVINSMIYPAAGIPLSTGTAWGTSITDNSANWNTVTSKLNISDTAAAFNNYRRKTTGITNSDLAGGIDLTTKVTGLLPDANIASATTWNTASTERRQWDGGSTNLVAATGRTSLGGTTVGQSFFTLVNPTAITFPRINADNTVSALDAASFRTAIGAGSSTITPAALTKVDDTNVTLTLGGTPATALLQAASITVGWTGTLADSRISSAATWNAKQAALVSGTNIKTINSNSLLGSSDISVATLIGFTPENSANKGIANGYASLDGGIKVPVAQLPSTLMIYKGTWNASINSPSLSDGTGTSGFVYQVSTAGSQNLGSGSISYLVGDYIMHNGTIWQKSAGTNYVSSVNSLQGVVTLTTANIAEGGTNYYWTAALSRAAQSLTVTGNSGAATYNNSTGVLNVPTYTLAGLGGISLTALSATAPLSYNNTTGAFTIATANTSTIGALSSTDWNTFNNKQNALTNPVTGTGVSGRLPYYNGTSSLTSITNFIFDGAHLTVPGNYYGYAFSGAVGSFSQSTGSALTVSNTNTSVQPVASFDNATASASTTKLTSWRKNSVEVASIENDGAVNALKFVKTSGTSSQILAADGSVITAGTNITISGGTLSSSGSSGTVTSVSVTTANGVSGSVATATTTPAITLTLGAITPTSVNGITLSGSTTPTLAVTGTTAVSGTNTGDNAVNSLYSGLVSNATHTGDATGATALTVVALRGVALPTLGASAGLLKYTGTGTNTWVFDASTYLTSNQTITLTGDVTGSGTTAITTTLATVNSNVGTFNSVTVNAKGLVTAATNVSYEVPLTFSTGLNRTGNTITSTITQYTDALARAAQNTASTSVTGLLSSTDWNTFNNKLSTATASTTYFPFTSGTLTGDLTIARNAPVFYLQNTTNLSAGGASRGDILFLNSASSIAASITANAITDNVGTTLVFKTRPVAGVLSNSLTLNENGDGQFHSTTASTNTTTGALKVSGGVGVLGAVNIGGALSGTSATFNGLLKTYANSGASSIQIVGRAIGNLGFIEFFNNDGTTVNSSINGGSSGLSFTGAATFSSTLTAAAFTPSYSTSYFSTDGTISNHSAGNYFYINGTGGLRLKANGSGDQKIVLEGGSSNDIYFTTANVERLRIASTGAITASNTFTAGGVIAGIGSIGKIKLTNGSSSSSGYLEIYKGDGTTRLGYIGYDNTNITYVAENGAIHSFTGGAATFSSSVMANSFAVSNSGTGSNSILIQNTGGQFYIGQEGSTAGGYYTGSAAYDNVLYASSAINIIVAGVKRMYVNGSGTTSTAFYESSDIRQKTVHETVLSNDGIDAIQYTFKPTGNEKWGYSAQQIQTVLKYAVTQGSDGFLKVDYTTVHTYKIMLLEKRVSELEEYKSLTEKRLLELENKTKSL